MSHLDLVILALVVVSFALSYLSQRYAMPVLAILNRWLRWVLFALLFALIYRVFDEEPHPPLGSLVAIGFLLYMLLETIYNWLAIGALSKSGMALFPAFRKNVQGDEWPAHKRYQSIREWLRSEQFVKQDSIKAELAEALFLRSSVYDQEDKTIRLQILFVPQRTGQLAMCFIFSSTTASGERYITDNVYMPFGGFYPETWHVVRKPLSRSIRHIYRRHLSHIEAVKAELVPWDSAPLDDLNEQQRELEQLNLRAGFLMPRDQQEEFGKISGDGRYRIWKEVWMLNYLGIASCAH